MGTRVIPKGARKVDCFEGLIKGEPPKQFVTVTLLNGYYSQGYKSNFSKIETWYLRVCWYGTTGRVERKREFSFSGKNIPQARKVFEREKKDVELIPYESIWGE